jgi:hypothetical protein
MRSKADVIRSLIGSYGQSDRLTHSDDSKTGPNFFGAGGIGNY